MVLGGLVIAMLFTALIGPYLVDWTAYRDTFEREASAYIGRPVTISGKADMRLLPTPVINFADVTIGDAAAPDIQMERFRAEVELASLLKGEIRVIWMEVERPHFRVDLARISGERAAGSGSGWRLDPERISLTHMEVAEGTAEIVDSRAGRSWRAEAIDAVIEAGSLLGPGKIDANFVLDGNPLVVKLGFGRLGAADDIPTTLIASSPLTPLTLSAEGTLALPSSGAPTYSGAVTVTGPPEPAEDQVEPAAPRSRWTDFRGVGAFELTPQALAVTEAQLSYGGMTLPLVLEGSGRLELGVAPRFEVSVQARQIDLDRAVGGGAEKPVEIADAVDAIVAALPRTPMASVPGVVRLDAQGVVLGGGVMQAVSARMKTSDEGWRVERLSATLPGETQIDVSGDLRISDAPGFRGHARAVSTRPAAFSAWWRGKAGTAALLDRFSVEADVELGPGIQRFSEIAAVPGEGTVSGSVELRRFEQSGQRFASVSLSADEADLPKARALAELLAGEALASGQIDQMTLSLRAELLRAGGIEARTVLLDGGLEDGELQLSRFSVADLAGASIEARGSIDDPFGDPTGHLDGSLVAEDVTGATTFLAGFLPENSLVARLQALAPKLSPAEAEISATFGASGEPLSLDLTGSFAGTDVTLTAKGQGSVNRPETLSGLFNLHVNGEDSGAVLAQLGLEVLPVPSGPLRLDADFQGALASPGTLKVDATIAGIQVTYLAETAIRDGKIRASGDFDANSADIDPMLLLAGLAVPGLGEGHAATAAGRLDIAARSFLLELREGSLDGEPLSGRVEGDLADGVALRGGLALQSVSLPALAGIAVGTRPGAPSGAWSDAPFAASIPPGLKGKFDLTAKELDLNLENVVTDPAIAIEMSAGALNIDLTAGGFAGGQMRGSVAGTIRDGEVDVALRASLAGGQLQALTWERGGLPVASGTIDGSIDIAAKGRSMAGLVSDFTGSGSFSVNDGRFNALNPEAIDAVMRSSGDGAEPDEAEARETFAILFGSGALPFGRAAGSFSVAAGALDVPTVSMAAGATTVLADAVINLNNFTLSSAWTIRQTAGAEAGGVQPFVTARFTGPIADPQRQIDLDPLLDLIRSRNLQRQLDELEVLEQQRRRLDAERQPPIETPPAGNTTPERNPSILGGKPQAETGGAAAPNSAVQMLREQGSALMNPSMADEGAPTALPFMPVDRPSVPLGRAWP